MSQIKLQDQPFKKRRWVPRWITEANTVRQEEGFKGMVKKGGWRLLAAFFLFYLVRDTILYVIPFMLGANCLSEYFQ